MAVGTCYGPAMNIADDKRPFSIDGVGYVARIQASMTRQSMRVLHGEAVIAEDAITFAIDGTRNLVARATLPDGRILEVEAGYINWITVAIAVRLDGVLIHESHPGKVIRWPDAFSIDPSDPADIAKINAQAEQASRFKRNLPSLLTDIGLGVVFFFVGSHYGLVTAAVVGAIAGVILWIVQKITRIDLLGGLAVFGIVISIISAAFAVVFQDPKIVQMRTTIIGLFVAALFLGDGVLFKGKFLGARLERYLPPNTDAARLAIGIGALGAFMAGSNAAVTELFSEEQWLFYTTFLDTPLAIALGFGVMAWARKAPRPH